MYKLYHTPTSTELFFDKDPTKLKISELDKFVELEYISEKFDEKLVDTRDISYSSRKIRDWADKNLKMKDVLFNEDFRITKVKIIKL